jgi:hypothetical protein
MNAVYHKIDGFLSFTPPWVLNCNVVFFQDFKIKKNHTAFLTKLKVLVLYFPYFTDNFNKWSWSDVVAMSVSASFFGQNLAKKWNLKSRKWSEIRHF